jgi:putative tricarboxylic transport membrane protein
MKARDVAAGAGCLLLAACYAWLTAQLPARSLPHTPGPTFFPWVLAAALALLGTLLILSGARGTTPDAAGPRGRFPWAALAAIAAYIALLPWAGFVAASVPFCALLMWIIGERRAWMIAAGAAGMPFGLMLLFTYVLQIPLPRDAFG